LAAGFRSHKPSAKIAAIKEGTNMTNDRCMDRRTLLRLGASAAFAPLVFSVPSLAQSPATTKIGVVGSGKLGGTVGGLWVKAGYQVMFSSRHPEELKELVAGLGANARAGSVAEAVAFGDAILVAVPYAALPQVGRDNAAALKGQVVMDACNPIPGRDGDIVQEAVANGVGETSAKYLPGTRLVRAFNSFGARSFASEAHRPGEPIGVPIASDDPEAIKVASKLVRDAGFEPVAVPLARAREFAPPEALFRQALPVSELKARLGIKG
jgi:8-hydroxy-5-deazaflavin:NADPH oxidoreductase